MEINFYSIFLFFSSLIILSLGLFVYIKQSRSPVNRAFSRFSFFVFIWSFSYAISYSTTTEQQAFFWLRIGYIGVILIPVGYYHFTYAFLNLKSHKKILISLYIMSFLFIYSLYKTNYFLNGLYEYSWGYYPKAGFLHPFYLVFLFLIAGSCDFLFFINWLKIRKEASVYKNKLQYILLGFIFGFLSSVDFIPNYGIEIYPFGWIFIVFSFSIIAYAILRYRLMDIRFIFKRTMAYSLSAGLLMAFFVILVLAITNLLSAYANVDSFKISIFAALVIALLFNPLRTRIQTLVDKVFYKKTYDYYATIQKVSHDLASMFDFKKIYSFIGDIIFSTLGLKNIYLLSAVPSGDYEVVYHTSYSKKEGKIESEDGKGEEGKEDKEALKIDRNSDMVKLLRTSDDIVVKDELPGIMEILGQEIIDNITSSLKPFNGEAVMPVFVDDKLEFLMILGEKLSGDIFTNEDISLIDTISHETAIALKNARLYKEMVFSERLASMGMMSATFAHEIRNPLTSIRTFAELLPDRQSDVEFRDKFLKIVVQDVERIDGLIKDLLDFSSGKKVLPRMENVDITALIDETLELLRGKFELEKRNISVEKIYKNVKINIAGDSKKLKQAFINVIGNGCQAMNENGVLKVNIIQNGRTVDVTITDTGKGMQTQDIARIFDPFYTTKPLGVGLGLAISKKIIEDHGGKIGVESKLSKGTIFTISLPMQNN